MIVGPVLVTVEAPSTAKLCAEPSGGVVCAKARLTIRFSRQITKKSFLMTLSPDLFLGKKPTSVEIHFEILRGLVSKVGGQLGQMLHRRN
jgi:hypothetical protein